MLKSVFTFLIFLAATSGFVSAGDDALIWKVTHNSKPGTLYLTGTVHIAKPSMFPLDAIYDKILSLSDDVIYEIYNPSTMEAALLTAKYGIYQPDDKKDLRKTLGEKDFSELSKFMRKYPSNFSSANIDRLKPWIVWQLVQYLPFLSDGEHSIEYGYEKIFTSLMDGRKGQSLESMKLQVTAIAKIPEDEIISSLREALSDEEKMKKEVSETLEAFKNGDDNTIQKLVLSELKKYPQMFEILINKRNVKMAEKLMKHLDSNRTLMVAVGGGHYLGENSINSILEKNSCKVERLKLSKLPGVLTLRAMVSAGAGEQIAESFTVKRADKTPAALEQGLAALKSRRAPSDAVFNTAAPDFEKWSVKLKDGRTVTFETIPSAGLWRQTDNTAAGNQDFPVMIYEKAGEVSESLFDD